MNTAISTRAFGLSVYSKGLYWLALVPLVLLSACGGGETPTPASSHSEPAALTVESTKRITAVDSNARGTLRSGLKLATVEPAAIAQAMIGQRVPALMPIYAVDTYRLVYMTIDGRGQPIAASGLLAVPRKAAGAASPVISYQHATTFRDAEAPSNNPTGSEPSVVLASLGYIVVAADYVGYGVSKGAPHPYLLAAPTAAAVVDFLYAARSFAWDNDLRPNGQLFLIGYSEGGYATAAAHRALQLMGGDIADAVIGSGPGGGPLDMGAALDELLRRVRSENSLLAFLVNPDLLQNLGSSVRKQVRREMLKRLLPEDSDVNFQTTFIDQFLANDREAIRRESDVHNWRPSKPVRLFHGRDDQTVPFIGSQSALFTMNDLTAPDVVLQECTNVPSGHLDCVPQYWQYVLGQMAGVARDL
jgi:pimeloyl-ACP methyl ester carboxylesterase